MKHKKAFALTAVLLAFGILPAACGKEAPHPEIAMQDIVEANRTTSILEQHGSFLVTVTYGDGEAAESYYVDEQIAYTSYQADGHEQHYMITRDEQAVAYFMEDGVYGKDLYVGDGWETDLTWVDNLITHEETTLGETVTGTRQDGEDLVVTTELTGERLDAQLYPGYESIRVEYLLEAGTKRVRSMKQTATGHDGTEETMLIEVAPDASRPAVAEELCARAFRTEDLRTVTVVVAPGTEAESSYSASVPRGGDVVALYFADENNTQLYYDPDFTQPVNELAADYEADVIYYMPAA